MSPIAIVALSVWGLTGFPITLWVLSRIERAHARRTDAANRVVLAQLDQARVVTALTHRQLDTFTGYPPQG